MLGCSGSVRLSILQVHIVGFLPKTPSWGQPLREELKPSASPDPGDPSVAFGEAPGPGLVAGSVCPEGTVAPGALQDTCTDTALGSWGVLPCQSLPTAHLPVSTVPQRPGSAPGAPCPCSPWLSPWPGCCPHGLVTLLAVPRGVPAASDHPPEHCARLQPSTLPSASASSIHGSGSLTQGKVTPVTDYFLNSGRAGTWPSNFPPSEAELRAGRGGEEAEGREINQVMNCLGARLASSVSCDLEALFLLHLPGRAGAR